MKILTAVFALCTGLAICSMKAGNPTAISGVIGAGALTVVCGALAWIER